MRWLLPILFSVTAHAQWWAGTVIESSPPSPHSVTMATGTFIVPKPDQQTSDTFCAIWVGLGGYWEWDRTLQQIGIMLNTQQGQPTVRVWYEFWPASYRYVILPVFVGDEIELTAKYVTEEDCELRIENLTLGSHFSVTRKVSKPDQGSGEWMIENDADCPLTRFPWIIWRDCRATVNGVETGIDNGIIEQWSQIDTLQVLTGVENSFAVAYADE